MVVKRSFVALLLWCTVVTPVTWAQHVHEGMTTIPVPAQKKPLYFCPMHPQITSDKPGTCPICHMDLQLAEESGEHVLQSSVEDRAAFTLPEENQRIIGVRTVPVRSVQGTRTLRALGRVASEPEAFTAIQDYKIAKDNFEQMKNSPSAALREQARTMLDAAAFRLKLKGLDVKVLEGNAENLLLPGSQGWIVASVFQSDLAFVAAGLPVSVRFSDDSRTYTGTVERINPTLDPKTRTVELRIRLTGAMPELRPEAFVHVEIQRAEGKVLVVPEDAVLRSGTHDLVFVREGKDRFVPRAVTVGRLFNEGYEITSGVTEGDEVVHQANFFIDSESRLRATLEQASGGANYGAQDSSPAESITGKPGTIDSAGVDARVP